jgi:hypothetical protein
MENAPMNDWLTATQGAAYAKCRVQSLYLAVKRKKLRAARINGQRRGALRFLHAWIDAWLVASATIEIVNPEAPGADVDPATRH